MCDILLFYAGVFRVWGLPNPLLYIILIDFTAKFKHHHRTIHTIPMIDCVFSFHHYHCKVEISIAFHRRNSHFFSTQLRSIPSSLLSHSFSPPLFFKSFLLFLFAILSVLRYYSKQFSRFLLLRFNVFLNYVIWSLSLNCLFHKFTAMYFPVVCLKSVSLCRFNRLI